MQDKFERSFVFRFLNWICPEHLVEEIEGDLIQKFNSDVEKFDKKRAKRRLIWNVIRFCRLGIVLRSQLSLDVNHLI